MGDYSALDNVLAGAGGWAGWVQDTGTKVVQSYLPKSTLQTGIGAAGTSAGVLGGAAPPVSGLPATIGGFKFSTVVLVGGALVVVALIAMKH